jgi:hypothetical protein
VDPFDTPKLGFERCMIGRMPGKAARLDLIGIRLLVQSGSPSKSVIGTRPVVFWPG